MKLSEEDCFQPRKPSDLCAKSMAAGLIPREVVSLQHALRWCRSKLGFDHAKTANGNAHPPGLQATDDCFSKLGGKRKNVPLFVTLPPPAAANLTQHLLLDLLPEARGKQKEW